MKTWRYYIGLAAVVGLNVAPALADRSNDLYFQESMERYFQYPQNARTFAMSGSSVMTSTDSSSVVGNPAGLGFMKRGELSGSWGHNLISGHEFPTGNDVEQNTNLGSGLLAIPLGQLPNETPEYGELGLGWDTSYSKWDDDSFDTDVRRQQLVASYGYAVDEDLSLGYSFGWTRDKFQARDVFDYPMANGFRHTIGALYKVDPDMMIGSTVFIGNGYHHALFGPGINETSDTFQSGVDVGGQYRMDDTLVSLGLDYTHVNSDGGVKSSTAENIVGGKEYGDVFNVRLGVEQTIAENYFVRAGYRFGGLANYHYSRAELQDLNGSAYYNAFTLGAGVVIPTDWVYVPAVKVDYGVEYRAVGNDDWAHMVTISLPFDVCGS